MNDFEAASAGIRRVLEVAGGSANAYEAEAPSPAPPAESSFEEATREIRSFLVRASVPQTAPTSAPNPESPPFEDSPLPGDEPSDQELQAFWRDHFGEVPPPEPTPKPELSEPEIECATGIAELIGRPKAPEPISPEYQIIGHTSDCGELEALWQAFTLNQLSEAGEKVELESGTYPILRSAGGLGWELHDQVKGLCYSQEEMHTHYSMVEPGATFIWAIREGNHEVLGYIYQAWCFIKR